LNEAFAEAWRLIGFTDRYINSQKPWAITDEAKFRGVLTNASYLVHIIAEFIRPFLPTTSDRIAEQIRFSDSTIEIKKGAVLFPRLNADDPKDRAVHTA
jgi:methionyl-tRNA synthetase